LFLSREETNFSVFLVSVEVNLLLALVEVDISVKIWFQQTMEVSENLLMA